MREARGSIDDARKSVHVNLKQKQFKPKKLTAVAKKFYIDTLILDGAGHLKHRKKL